MPIAEELSSWFDQANPSAVLGLGLALNLVINATSLLLWRTVYGSWGSRRLSGRDGMLFASTTLVNVAVILPAWWLWKQEIVVLRPASLGHGLVEVLYLLGFIDLVMYCAHRLFHQGALYRWFHSWHHQDDSPTSAQLFVMHPGEALGFGLAILAAISLWSISLPALSMFLFLNVLFGTFGHLPESELGVVASRLTPLVWISRFHQDHHRFPNTNYGFFSPSWDRLARTAKNPATTVTNS